MDIYNIFENLEFSDRRELEDIIFENEKIKVIRTASLGQTTDYYNQEELEMVKIEKGWAKLEVEGDIIDLKEGDILAINPHQIHRVISQGKTIWLCIFVK